MSDIYSGRSEKRKFVRSRAGFMVTYKVKDPFEARRDFGEAERDGVANDLSEQGLSLLTDYDLPVGAVIFMKFRLSSNVVFTPEGRSRKLELRGEVRHSLHTQERSTYRAGVRFQNLPADVRTFIAGCI